MSDSTEAPKKKFEPKQPVELAPPKDDVISLDYLNKCDGEPKCSPLPTKFIRMLTLPCLGKTEGYPTLVAIKVRAPKPLTYCIGVCAL
jgi:membrane-associated progesterone receptor component